MSSQLNRPFVVLGAGGHAGVVIDLLEIVGCTVLGVADVVPPKKKSGPLAVPFIGGDETVLGMSPNDIYLAMGVGSVGSTNARTALYEKFVSKHFVFPSLVHPRSVVSKYAEIGGGSIVMAGAVVQTAVRIGSNCIINTQASVDHDCNLGNGVHIAPGVVLSGGVSIGNDVHIGTGAQVVHSINIGARTFIGAGVTVVKDVPADMKIRAKDASVWNG